MAAVPCLRQSSRVVRERTRVPTRASPLVTHVPADLAPRLIASAALRASLAGAATVAAEAIVGLQRSTAGLDALKLHQDLVRLLPRRN
eukprot:13057106-Alexandrium_andersonii.AAC.1